MRIVESFPPNFPAIFRVFPGAYSASVIFAYAPDIYTMSPKGVTPEIIAHEMVHIERQLAYPGGVEAWWARYLWDVEWRYNEELVAHQAEYRHLAGMSRQLRRSALKEIAKKLAAPLYGNMVTVAQAAKDIAA